MGITTVLGHAIDLQHVQAQALVPMQQGLGHRRRPGQGNPQGIQPQARQDLVPDPLADERQTQEKIQAPGWHLAVDPHLELGPDSRYPEHRRGPGTSQVNQEGIETFSEEHRLSGVDRRHLDEHALGHMAQRQVGQQPVIGAQAKQVGPMAGGKPQVGEAVHHTLGHPGGAGGIDDGGQLLSRWAGTLCQGLAALQVVPAKSKRPRGPAAG